MKVMVDVRQLASGNAHRGVGSYTRLLVSELEQLPDIELIKPISDHLTQRREKPDIIHYPFFDLFFPTLPFHFITPGVVTIHDVIPLKFPQYYPRGKRGSIMFRRQLLALKTVSAIITDSLSSKTDIVASLGCSEDKVSVISLAAHPGFKQSSPEEVKETLKNNNLPSEYVLYVGDINYNKNIPQLIKAVKFLPDSVHLVCVGKNFFSQPIPEWQWIEVQLALSGVAERVHFVTTILQDQIQQLSALYSGAIAYIQPSLYEGFGLPILEAMKCRTPVVSTPLSSLPEVAGEHAIYVQPDAEAIAGGVREVMDWSKTKRIQVTRAAAQWADHYSWTKTAKETVEVYKKVCRR